MWRGQLHDDVAGRERDLAIIEHECQLAGDDDHVVDGLGRMDVDPRARLVCRDPADASSDRRLNLKAIPRGVVGSAVLGRHRSGPPDLIRLRLTEVEVRRRRTFEEDGRLSGGTPPIHDPLHRPSSTTSAVAPSAMMNP